MPISDFTVSRTKYSNKLLEATLNDTLNFHVGPSRLNEIDESVLKRYLGTSDLSAPIPTVWINLKTLPKQIKASLG